MSLSLSVQKRREGARLPAYATDAAAGLDLCACLDKPVTLEPGQRVSIPTGVAVAPGDAGTALFLFGRSGLAFRHGLILSNGVGVIDADYRGEICVSLTHLGDTSYIIQPGDRIAQLVPMAVPRVRVVECQRLDDTARGTGGFGSTGQ